MKRRKRDKNRENTRTRERKEGRESFEEGNQRRSRMFARTVQMKGALSFPFFLCLDFTSMVRFSFPFFVSFAHRCALLSNVKMHTDTQSV